MGGAARWPSLDGKGGSGQNHHSSRSQVAIGTPLPPHAAAPGCWHSLAPATPFWLRLALINIFNYKMNMLTHSAYRAGEMEERASADIAVKFLEDVGTRQPQLGAGMLRGAAPENPAGREGGAGEEPHGGRGAKPSLEENHPWPFLAIPGTLLFITSPAH